MIENFEQMRKRHENEIKNLQENCKHKKISKWMPYMWAIGHYGGDVKVCEFCGKIVKQKQMKIDMFKVVENETK